jgi:aerobic-type carbon monoxide dehydrogenase small subunit (CoxS/CutS family)
MREALSTVLCRCFAHTRMLRAIRRYQTRRA